MHTTVYQPDEAREVREQRLAHLTLEYRLLMKRTRCRCAAMTRERGAAEPRSRRN